MSEPRVGLLRGRITQSLLASLWPAAVFALASGSVVAFGPGALFVMPIAIVVGFGLAVRTAMSARPVVEHGALRVRNGVVLVGEREVIGRAKITSGVVMPSAPEGVVVRLERAHTVPIDLKVEDIGQAQEALDALQLDAGHAVARFRVLDADSAAYQRRMRLLFPALVMGVVTAAIAARSGMPSVLAVMLLLMLASSFSTAMYARVTVGSDGLSFRRWGRDEFLSLDGIVDAVTADGDRVANSMMRVVQLRREDGSVARELVVDVKKRKVFTERLNEAIDARAEALAERIREVIRLRRAREGVLNPSALARGDREHRDWVSSLRAMLDRTTGFRDEGPPSPDALLAMVEDTSARAIDRAAAAVALSKADASFKTRVRVAAGATAAPQLRLALEAAVDDDEQKLTSALEEIERAREA